RIKYTVQWFHIFYASIKLSHDTTHKLKDIYIPIPYTYIKTPIINIVSFPIILFGSTKNGIIKYISIKIPTNNMFKYAPNCGHCFNIIEEVANITTPTIIDHVPIVKPN